MDKLNGNYDILDFPKELLPLENYFISIMCADESAKSTENE